MTDITRRDLDKKFFYCIVIAALGSAGVALLIQDANEKIQSQKFPLTFALKKGEFIQIENIRVKVKEASTYSAYTEEYAVIAILDLNDNQLSGDKLTPEANITYGRYVITVKNIVRPAPLEPPTVTITVDV